MAKPWYWELGFNANPLSIKPGSLSNDVIAHPVEKIMNRIEKGSVQFIEAPPGSGKTAVLKRIIERFGGKGKLIYCNCINGESVRPGRLLRNSGLAGKLFGRMTRDAIFLVDEAQDASEDDLEKLGSMMESSAIKSIVFFGTDSGRLKLPKNLEKSMKGGITELSSLTVAQSTELVRARVGNLRLLPDHVIRELSVRVSGNPRKLLEYCETLCRKAVESSIKELTISHANTLLKSESGRSVRKHSRRRTG